MATVVAPPRPVARARPGAHLGGSTAYVDDAGDGRTSRFGPGWPLAMLFCLYPLWWILGVTQLVAAVACALLLAELLRTKPIARPQGLTLWVLFLVWVLAGVVVLQVNAPGALPGASSTRYLTWALRVVWYLEATIVLLYVTTMRKRLGTDRLTRILATMFVVTVAGGLLGVLFPTAELHSAIEYLLPHGIRSNAFVVQQTQPFLTEHQEYLGTVNDRPSGPFPDANQWGLNFACFLPFFMSSWGARTAGWRRLMTPLVLAVAVVPVVYSLNRGLWACLALMMLFYAVQQARNGNYRAIASIAGVVAAVVAVVAVSPLSGALERRFNSHNSDAGRTDLSVRTILSTLHGSPIMGFGTTRNVQGSFYSIAGGATSTCPSCGPPALGTQGFIWLLVFGAGFVGAVLCLAFFVLHFLRGLPLRSPQAVTCQLALLSFLVTLPIYDWSTPAAIAVMSAVALLWRAREEQPLAWVGPPVDDPPTLTQTPLARRGAARLVSLVSRRDPRGIAILLACVLVGACTGGAWRHHVGRPVVASASVVVPATPVLATDGSAGQPLTLDTEARFFSSAAVLHRVSAVVGHRVSAADSPLEVTATANTRVLTVAVHSTDPRQAKREVTSAVEAFIELRALRESALVANRLDRLRAQQRSLTKVLDQTVTDLTRLQAARGPAARGAFVSAASAHLYELTVQLRSELAELQQEQQSLADTSPAGRAHIVAPPAVRSEPHETVLAVTSGALIGLLAGVVLIAARRRWWLKLAVVRPDDPHGTRLAGLPVWWLAGSTRPPASMYRRWGGTQEPAAAVQWAQLANTTSFISFGDDLGVWRATARLEALSRRLEPLARTVATPRAYCQRSTRVVLVGSPHATIDALSRALVRLDACGVPVVAVFLMRDRDRGQTPTPGMADDLSWREGAAPGGCPGGLSRHDPSAPDGSLPLQGGSA